MGTLNDRTYEYLGGLGFSGSLNDRMVAYWASEGFSGSFNDKCKAFLKTSGFKTLNKWMESLDGPAPEPSQERTPWDGTTRSMHSGHSLTDAYFNSSEWYDGDLVLIRDGLLDPDTGDSGTYLAKSTIGGSSMKQRWDDDTVAPAISGTPTEGVEISVTNGTWTNSPDEYEYQWRLDSSIEGSAKTFTPEIGSAGQWCSAWVRARKTGGFWSDWVNATGEGGVAPA